MLNNLLDGLNRSEAGGLTAEEKEARSNLVSGLVAGIAGAAGGEAATAGTAARIETENNAAFVPIVVGAVWLADKGLTAYEAWQDVNAVRDGKKTVEQLAQEKGEEYVAAVIAGNLAKYGVKVVKRGGKWVAGKSDDVVKAEKAVGEAGSQIPGRVQSRINIASGRTETTPLRESGHKVSAGFDHVLEGHFNRTPANHRSVFTIEPEDLRGLLQSKSVVQSQVVAMPDGQFARTVDVGRVIGTTALKDGGMPTTTMMILTDKAGNLITTYPVKASK